MLWESQRDHRCQEGEHDIPRTKSLLWYRSLSHHYLCANTLVLAENTLNIFPTIRYASSILSYYVGHNYYKFTKYRKCNAIRSESRGIQCDLH
jgi:hypothetical protein